MHSCVKNVPQWGRVLWLSNGETEIGIALDFGIRVVHMSCVGMENLFYEQPADLSDSFCTEDGWKLYGGHRLWLAPEGDDSYYPDNAPVQYTMEADGVLLEQEPDPLLGVQKRMRVTFLSDGGIRLEQMIENVTDQPMVGASWGVNTLDSGGTATINCACPDLGGFTPTRVVALWSDTNLHDARLSFGKEQLVARHMPSEDYLKLGLYSKPGKAVFENKGQRFTLLFEAEALELYPDYGCNFELYMCTQFMELETLGLKTQILPGQSACHTETWYLTKA